MFLGAAAVSGAAGVSNHFRGVELEQLGTTYEQVDSVKADFYQQQADDFHDKLPLDIGSTIGKVALGVAFSGFARASKKSRLESLSSKQPLDSDKTSE